MVREWLNQPGEDTINVLTVEQCQDQPDMRVAYVIVSLVGTGDRELIGVYKECGCRIDFRCSLSDFDKDSNRLLVALTRGTCSVDVLMKCPSIAGTCVPQLQDVAPGDITGVEMQSLFNFLATNKILV